MRIEWRIRTAVVRGALTLMCLLGGSAHAQLLKLPGKAAPVATAAAFEPSWPQRFELLGGERGGTAFPVTRVGPVQVEVHVRGAPLAVTLVRPDGRTVERQGTGRLAIDDAATEADIARGVIWRVALRGAQPGGGVPGAVLASGQIAVQHPAVDAAQAQAAIARLQQQAAQQLGSARPAAVVPAQQLTEEAQAARDKAVADQHAARLQALRPALPAEVHAQLTQRVALRAQGQSVQQAAAVAPSRLVVAPAGITSMAIAAAPPTKTIRTGGLLGGGVTMPAGANTGSQGAAATGAAPLGSGGGAAATVAPAPAITALSTTEGDPGTPVSLTGSDFGGSPGELHFIVGNGRDVPAPVTYWSATQIVAEVPYADGLPVYDGHVYVKRADGAKSALRPFRFVPVYDVATIATPLRLDHLRGWVSFDSAPDQIPAYSLGVGKPNLAAVSVFGDANYDEFYVHARLKNGWVTDSATVDRASTTGLVGQGAGNAYVVDLRAGTDSPWVKVRWWVDPLSQLTYSIRVTVKRPRNLPCASQPCAVL